MPLDLALLIRFGDVYILKRKELVELYLVYAPHHTLLNVTLSKILGFSHTKFEKKNVSACHLKNVKKYPFELWRKKVEIYKKCLAEM